MSDFDFEAWSTLARRSPSAYFRARERAIERLINSYPPDEAARLREFQVQIDSVRALAGSPAKATRELVGMMEDRLEAMSARIRALQRSSQAMQHLKNH
ncbi:MAG: DUF3135 domain-containing protein, partial [Rhodocyclaceae bacterium]|nr:DUF3135 domain-containing protein [Rhodocyclaceae bacterium]